MKLNSTENTKREGLNICLNCMWQGQCRCDGECEHFDPSNEEMFENIILPQIKDEIVPRKERKLSRKIHKNRYVVYDDDYTPLDSYYVGMINDVLQQIRHGDVAYVFTLDQVKEILSFEENTHVILSGGIYYLSL